MTENDADIITFLPPKGNALTESSLPEDIRGATAYLVEVDAMGDHSLANEAREIINRSRCYTLGEAIEALSKRRSDMRFIIRMPEPRQPPWTSPPCILVGGRPPPGVTVRLTDKQRANLLELLKLIGFRNGAPPEQLKGLGGSWMTELGLDVEAEAGDPISERPDFTHEELLQRFK